MDIFQSARWYKGYQPIAVMPKGIIVYKKGNILKLQDGKMSIIANVRLSASERLKESVSLLRRLYRREIRCSCVDGHGNVLFFKNGVLFKLNNNSNIISKIWEVPKGYSTPLNMVASLSEKDFVYWGDYFSNPMRRGVKIYGLGPDNRVQTVYSFPEKTIRHIHNIIKDGDKGFYIFAGDDDPKAGIYHSDKDFKNVEPIYIGDKQARCVVGFVHNDGLIFATDSVVQANHIYYLHRNDEGEWVKDTICQTNGSCIYGTKYKDTYIFSTTVEPPESTGSISDLFSRELGSGILTNDVEVVQVYGDFRHERIGHIRKDSFPYKLFQYGVVKFPDNTFDRSVLCFYPVAVVKRDGVMGILRG